MYIIITKETEVNNLKGYGRSGNREEGVEMMLVLVYYRPRHGGRALALDLGDGTDFIDF